MSNKAQWDSETPSDPYAGQYPPPPPLQHERQSLEQQQQQQQQQQSHERQSHESSSARQEPFYLVEPVNSGSSSSRHQLHDNRSSSLPASLHSRYSYPDQSRISDSINRQANNIHTNGGGGHFYEYEDHDQRMAGEYYDPEAMNLKEYLEAEREEKLRKQHQKQYSTSSSAHISNSSEQQQVVDMMIHHPPPQPEQPYYNNSLPPFYHHHEEPYPPNTMASPLPMPPPMLMSPPNNPSFNQPNFMVPPTLPFAHPHPMQNNSNSQLSNQGGTPYGPLPGLQPPPPPFDEKYNRSGCCSCFCCQDISFCGWFRTLLLSLIFFAGIGLIIASKVISDQCQSCQGSSCPTSTCTDVFHAGFLYGGIVIAGLSALIIVWRILKWLCAGR